jgi:AcrR family transcriptional regulator
MRDPHGKIEVILDSALKLFTEQGFHKTPVPEIANKAGIGAGTIYRYFKSKEDLVNALYQKWKGIFSRMLVQGFPENEDEKAQFFHLWNKMAQFQIEHPQPFQFLEFHFHANYLDRESLKIEEASHVFLSGFFEKCRGKNLIKNIPPEALIGYCYGAFLGLVKYYEKMNKKLDKKIVQAIGESCWQGMLK